MQAYGLYGVLANQRHRIVSIVPLIQHLESMRLYSLLVANGYRYLIYMFTLVADCLVNVHENSCKDQISPCVGKYRQLKVSVTYTCCKSSQIWEIPLSRDHFLVDLKYTCVSLSENYLFTQTTPTRITLFDYMWANTDNFIYGDPLHEWSLSTETTFA